MLAQVCKVCRCVKCGIIGVILDKWVSVPCVRERVNARGQSMYAYGWVVIRLHV